MADLVAGTSTPPESRSPRLAALGWRPPTGDSPTLQHNASRPMTNESVTSIQRAFTNMDLSPLPSARTPRAEEEPASRMLALEDGSGSQPGPAPRQEVLRRLGLGSADSATSGYSD